MGVVSICHFLVLDPRLKAMCSIYSSHPIGLLLYFIGPWTFAPSSKVALSSKLHYINSKWCHGSIASICHFLVLDPHLTAMGPIYGSHPIALLLCFIGPWTFEPSSKVALSIKFQLSDLLVNLVHQLTYLLVSF